MIISNDKRHDAEQFRIESLHNGNWEPVSEGTFATGEEAETAMFGLELDLGWRDLRVIDTSGDLYAQGMTQDESQLSYLVQTDQLGAIRELIAAGANIDEVDQDGQTALHQALSANSPGAASLLLELGANPNQVNDLGQSPLHISASEWSKSFDDYNQTKHLSYMKMLLKAGANPNLQNSDSDTPLHIIVDNGNEGFVSRNAKSDAINTLLNNAADVNIQGQKKQTPLHIAAKSNDTESIRLLVNSGADHSIKGWRKNSPLHFCAENGNLEAAKILISAGADLSSTNLYGLTPLQLVAADSEAHAMLQSFERQQSLLDIANQSRSIEVLIDHATTQAIIRTDRDGSTELRDGASLHTAANLSAAGAQDSRFDQAPYWLVERGQAPAPIQGAADAALRAHITVDERASQYAKQEQASQVVSERPDAELASAQQIQAKRQAYGRAM